MPQMSVWMIVASIIAVLVFLLIGFVLGVMYRKKVSEREIASAEDEAKRIINEGIKAAENKKREALLEAKEEIHRTRTECDREVKERRNEVSKQERRLQQKEENLDRKTEALEKLIQDGRIHPARIEEMVAKAQREVNQTIKEEGERAVFETNVHGLHPDLVKLLGRQRYRTSYGQNVLNHSIEVAQISGLLAAELGVDIALAKRAGLLHDLGKSIDHEVEGSHVTIGVDLARKYKESEEVIHAIEAHHGDVEPHTVIACIVQAADTISAARPGARRENIENYVKRLEKLEEVSRSFPGIASCYAIQAGREIRVMVKPEEVSEDQIVLLARDIAKKIEAELTYPGQIKVHVLRETKAVDYAK